MDVTDIEHPREVATYEVPEGGIHNVWVENDVLVAGDYAGGGQSGGCERGTARRFFTRRAARSRASGRETSTATARIWRSLGARNLSAT